ncbi:MAG: hypothetical protein ACYC7E_17220 [Armatimonadota bacterium]
MTDDISEVLLSSEPPRKKRWWKYPLLTLFVLVLLALGFIIVEGGVGIRHELEYVPFDVRDLSADLTVSIQNTGDRHQYLGLFAFLDYGPPYTLWLAQDFPLNTPFKQVQIRHLAIHGTRGKIKEIPSVTVPLEEVEQYRLEDHITIKSYTYIDSQSFTSDSATLTVEGELVLLGAKERKKIQFSRQFNYRKIRRFEWGN